MSRRTFLRLIFGKRNGIREASSKMSQRNVLRLIFSPYRTAPESPVVVAFRVIFRRNGDIVPQGALPLEARHRIR